MNKQYWYLKERSPKGFRKASDLGPAGCPKQKMDDGRGNEMWESVEEFAKNQTLWQSEMLDALAKVQVNQLDEKTLKTYKTWTQVISGQNCEYCDLHFESGTDMSHTL